MSFWETTKRWLNGRVKQEADPKTANWVGPTYNFQGWASGFNFGSQNNTLSTNEEIFSVITRLANTVSSLPIHLYKNYKEVNNNVSDLLHDEANPSMSAFSLINQLEVSRNSSGNGYAFIEREIGRAHV